MIYFKWTITTLLFLMINKSRCLASSPGLYSKQASCIGLVATRHYERNSTIGLLATDSYDYPRPTLRTSKRAMPDGNLIKLLSQSSHFSIVILKPDENNSYCLNELPGKKAVDYYVFAGSLHEVVSCIETFCFDKLTHDRCYFVIYLEMKTRATEDIVRNVLELFWTNEHQNVIILADGLQGYIDVYTWFPLEVTPQVEVVDQCDGTDLRQNKPLFSPKVTHNLNGRRINVGLVVTPPITCDRIGGGYAGPQISIMKSMAKTLNFTAVYRTSNNITTQNETEPGRLLGSIGPWRTILRGTLAGEVSVALGGFVMWPTLLDDFSFTQTINQEEFSFFVTNDLILSNRTERWIWAIVLEMIGVQLFTALAMYALSRSAKGRKEGFASTAVMVWSLLTDSSTKVSQLSPRQVLLWIICAFYAININSANRSVLTAFLATPTYVETVETLRDMVQSDLPVLFITAVEAGIGDVGLFSVEEVSLLENRVTSCHAQFEHCLTTFASWPQYCWTTTMGFKQFLEVVVPHQKYHILDPPIGIPLNTIYTKKNFFLTRKMSMLLLRAAQAGLLDHWYTKFLRNYKICDLNSPDWTLLRNTDALRPVSDDHSDKSLRPFNMDNLYSPFRLLGYGLILAMLVLVIEVLTAAQVPRATWTCLKSYFTCARHKPLLPLQFVH